MASDFWKQLLRNCCASLIGARRRGQALVAWRCACLEVAAASGQVGLTVPSGRISLRHGERRRLRCLSELRP